MSTGRPARARAAAVLVTAALGATTAITAIAATAPGPAAAAAPGADSPRLVLEAPSWAFEGRAVRLAVEPRGALEGRPLTLTVVVDGRAVERVACDGRRTTIPVAAAHLAAGTREIGVKCGTERSSVRVRVVPVSALWITAVLAGLVVSALVAARRRRRAA